MILNRLAGKAKPYVMRSQNPNLASQDKQWVLVSYKKRRAYDIA